MARAVAIGGEPDPLNGAQRFANDSELGRFVAALCRASAVKTFGPQQDRRPALPLGDDIFRLEQVEQMTLGRKDFTVTSADGGAHVFRLAGFFRDNDCRILGRLPRAGVPSMPRARQTA